MNAETVFKFCQSDIVRFLFLMTDEALTTLAKEVSWFGEWKTAGGLIDFKGDINAQHRNRAKDRAQGHITPQCIGCRSIGCRYRRYVAAADIPNLKVMASDIIFVD